MRFWFRQILCIVVCVSAYFSISLFLCKYVIRCDHSWYLSNSFIKMSFYSLLSNDMTFHIVWPAAFSPCLMYE